MTDISRSAWRQMDISTPSSTFPQEAVAYDGKATKIRRQIDEAFTALAKAETSYAAKGTPLDHSLFESARGVLMDLTQRLNDIRREVAMASMRTFIDKTFMAPDLPILQDKFRPLVKKMFPALASAIDTQRLLREAALEFLEKHNDATLRKMNTLARELASLSSAVENELKSIEKQEYKGQPIFNLVYEERPDTRDLVNSLSRKDRNACTPELVKEFRQAVLSFVADNVEAEFGALKVAYGGIFGASTQTAHLVQMFRNAAGHDPSKFLTNKTLAAVFEGRAAVTTVVETRLAGLPDEDADPALDSANAVSSKPLGSGQVNTVYQISYKDGSTYIFKPEAPGRRAEAKAASRCWRMQSERHNLRQECAGRCKQPSGPAVPSRPPSPHCQARLVRGVSLLAKCIF